MESSLPLSLYHLSVVPESGFTSFAELYPDCILCDEDMHEYP